MTTCRIIIDGTFPGVWTFVATLLAAGHVFAQAPLTATQTSAPKAALPRPLAWQADVAAPATQTSTKAVSGALIEPESGSEANSIVQQIKAQAAPRNAKTADTGGNDLSEQISHLEPTGQYVERDLRIPEGNNARARFVRLLVPIYKEKDGNKAPDRGNQYR